MNKFAFLVVTVALSSAGFAQERNTKQVATVRVTISGNIKNFDEFAARVVPGTYIQLVPMPSDGTVWSTAKFVDGKPRAFYDSDLVKLSVPKKAAFSFAVPDTPPGKYFLAAQQLKTEWIKPREGPMFLTNAGVVLIIDVPVATKSPFTVNAGGVVVQIN